jgi:hypothetical protein
VLSHRALPETGGERFLQTAALVGFGAKQQNSGREILFLEARQQLIRCH